MARRVDNASLLLLDLGVVVAAWLLAYGAGFEGDLPSQLPHALVLLLGIPVLAQVLVNRLTGLYGPVWRYASVDEGARVVLAVAIGAAVSTLGLALVSAATNVTLPMLTTPPIAALLTLLGCGGVRFQARLFALERQRETRDLVRTLIVGADHVGASLATELQGGKADTDVELVGFLDRDPKLVGRSVRGFPVLGTVDGLEQVCHDHGVERILVTLPETGRDETQAVIDRALATDAQVKVLPPANERIGGPLVRGLRDLDLADLLGREHTPVDTVEIGHYLEGATVLVSGAGGSIGSEIARQVARYKPARLLLLDRDESLLHDVLVGDLADAVPVLADIRDRAPLEDLFARERPDVVFHAAAHKHVPMLERHPVEAVRTNLLGTWWLAQTAAHSGCRRFVHISTDKAARPCSVMGATKRGAELVVQEVAQQYDLPFAAVRFGNVLGSRGSVVPTFLRQILEGGPVTVTDPEMTRYFMTIPEAVSLVLQAGSMADEGDVFLLEMGDPVAIVDLARQMIRLAGLRPDEDIPIEVVGTRPGERLHEQLHDDAEIAEPSSHPSIHRVTSQTKSDPETLFFFLELLERHCAAADDRGAASLLEQLLRQNGVECRLHVTARDDRDDETGDDTDLVLSDDDAELVLGDDDVEIVLDEEPDAVPAHPARPAARSDKLPALLGGPQAFAPNLPFARPTRPVLGRVFKRLEPSYERGVLTNGPLVAELEELIADRLGVDHAIAVSSCTSGLMLSVQALTEGRSGPVVLPSFTFSASAHAVAWNGRTPRFVECDPATFQIDIERAAEALDGAAALMGTHVFGAPCRPHTLADLARRHNLPLLFDAAHALGAVAQGCRVGGFGEAEVFSLTPTKVLVAGEGGIVATNDSGLAGRLRIGRDYGNPGDYDTRFVGLNARMSEFHAAMALESLLHLDESLGRRLLLARRYQELLADVPGIRFQAIEPGDLSTYKDLTIAVDAHEFGLTRDQLVSVLATEGIDTRNYFDPPVHRQQSYGTIEHGPLPVTEQVASSVVSLPMYTDLTEGQVELIAESIAAANAHAIDLDNLLANLDGELLGLG